MIFHTPQRFPQRFPQNIREHMFFYRINQNYHICYWHGEATPSEPPTRRVEHYNMVQFNDVDSTIEMVEVVQVECQNDLKLLEILLQIVEKPFIS